MTADGGLLFGYLGLDGVTVRTHVAFDPAPTLGPAKGEQGGSVVARWKSPLRPGERRQIAWTVHATREPDQTLHGLDQDALDPGHAHAAWLERGAKIETDNELVNQVIRRSMSDLRLLESIDPMGEPFIAAGVPWFATLFGRDSLITSLQSLPFLPRVAIETLEILARRQATAEDPWRDAEPGKILHELRTGEMSRTGELPFSPYYGSVDATPLWLILLGETYDWTGDDGLVDRLWPNAMAALDWIDQWGDRDGDGFVEYERRAETGLRNQGWKDSIGRDPLARRNAGRDADRAGRGPGLRLRREAADGATRPPARRDGPGRPARRRGARPSAPVRRAVPAARRIDRHGPRSLEATGRFHRLQRRVTACGPGSCNRSRRRPSLPPSGPRPWIRAGACAPTPPSSPATTRSATTPARSGRTTPRSPRPACGATGSTRPRERCPSGLLSAAQHFPAFRLPELFCGFDRAATGAPIAYPVACSPQAWAAGATLMIIGTILGLQADASAQRLTLDRPNLPADLTKVVIRVSGSATRRATCCSIDGAG